MVDPLVSGGDTVSRVDLAFFLVVIAVVVRATPPAVGWISARLAARDDRRAELEREAAYAHAIPAAEHVAADPLAVRHVELELGARQ